MFLARGVPLAVCEEQEVPFDLIAWKNAFRCLLACEQNSPSDRSGTSDFYIGGEFLIRVLHVISDTNIGGAGVHLCNLLSCIDRSLFDVSVCLPKNSLLAPRIRALGVPVIETAHGADRSADLYAIPELMGILRRQKPHILHTHSALYARLAGLFCRVPISISTRHCADIKVHPTLLQQLAVRELEQLIGGHTIATANYVKDVIISSGVPKKKIHVIHNGSRPLPYLSDGDKEKLRRKWGLSPDEFTVGIVARLEKGKGHDTFLRAASLCLSKNPNIRFFVVGDGSLDAHLRSLACQLGLGDRVLFTGFQADIAPIMNILHLNVNCSERSETSSLSLSEGMSVGTVPIVSRCGGNPYMAGFGENGAVFPIGDATALANIILSLERNRDHLSLLSQACQSRFQKDFTAEKMTKQVQTLYQKIANNKF